MGIDECEFTPAPAVNLALANNGIFNLNSFLILFFLLYKLAYGPLIKMLDSRSAKIKESLDAAERAKESVKESEDKIQAEISKARQEGQKLIADEGLTINGGAIKGWNRRNRFYFHQLKCLAKHYQFHLDTPWEDYSEEIQKIILWGSKDKVDFSKSFRSGSKFVRKHKFEGIIPNTERRFKETDSEFIGNKLAKLLSESHCDSCEGSRLKKESRNIFINQTPIQDITKEKITTKVEQKKEEKLKKVEKKDIKSE